MFFIWYIILDRSFYRFVTVHACDGRTDRILIARPRLHPMQRVENEIVAPTLTGHATYILQGWKGREKEGREGDPEWEGKA